MNVSLASISRFCCFHIFGHFSIYSNKYATKVVAWPEPPCWAQNMGVLMSLPYFMCWLQWLYLNNWNMSLINTNMMGINLLHYNTHLQHHLILKVICTNSDIFINASCSQKIKEGMFSADVYCNVINLAFPHIFQCFLNIWLKVLYKVLYIKIHVSLIVSLILLGGCPWASWYSW